MRREEKEKKKTKNGGLRIQNIIIIQKNPDPPPGRASESSAYTPIQSAPKTGILHPKGVDGFLQMNLSSLRSPRRKDKENHRSPHLKSKCIAEEEALELFVKFFFPPLGSNKSSAFAQNHTMEGRQERYSSIFAIYM
jgi:hypothetical protein